ncbi:MAG TPA: hypothetical protein DDX54_05495 [Rhodospirillaceae bacterium]|jgi:succinoglycan biosynthesis protein ExoM|nr:glycosyltransferase family 2 protein [Alphaproteobacteria bacterium]HBH26837.1 hypothetical protein [Rhodospirillaceae bacterium]
MPESPLSVLVAVCTLHRPQMLRRCLDSLCAQEGAPPLRILVVDNSPDAECRDMVAEHYPQAVYASEPRRGLSHARNKAVDEALRLGADWLAFIDDDEIARPDWIASYMAAMATHPAEIYHGPAVPIYPPDLPAWFRIRPPHDRELRYNAGSIATGNVLFSRGIVENLTFDPAFNRTGGEDLDFFCRAQDLGARVVWVPDAVVHEPVVPERTTLAFVLRNAYETGLGKALLRIHQGKRIHTLVRKGPQLLFRTVYGIFLALVAAPIAPFWPQRVGQFAAWKANRVCHAAGMLAGLLGYRARGQRPVEGY